LIRSVQNRHHALIVGKVIAELGGTIGSIQAPLSPNSDYRIMLPAKSLWRADLGRLAVIRSLAMNNSVSICFEETISDNDLIHLRAQLPNVRIVQNQPAH
jgi:hypothetical protein